MEDYEKHKQDPLPEASMYESWCQMAVMDVISGNWDRHFRNFMIDPGTKTFVAIDNGAGFTLIKGYTPQRVMESIESKWDNYSYIPIQAGRGAGRQIPVIEKKYFDAAKEYANSDKFKDMLNRHFGPIQAETCMLNAVANLLYLETHSMVEVGDNPWVKKES